MTFLSDKALQRLRALTEAPDLSGTRYRLLERVARGGMGVVYAAQDVKLARRVALKILDHPDHSGDLSGRLIREARVLARLEHPGIVPVHDVGTLTDERVFYTMKFVEGLSLDDYAKRMESLPDRLRLFLQICDAVAFAHARGVLHRDLKPANIMVGSFGEVLVMDWGLAKVLSDAGRDHAQNRNAIVSQAIDGEFSASDNREDVAHVATNHGTVMGTPGYMSPEQAGGNVEALDARSDIFSLGAILKFLAEAPVENSVTKSSWMNKPLAAISAKAMAAHREDRYQNVSDFSAEVSNYLDGRPIKAYRESFLERSGRFYRRHNIAILLIAVYLLVRAILILFFRR
ncbi:MAG TPA: serine/threonine-protein kinase [Candidatus Acidoferrum sp.]|jgi:serine/threonine protein kinase